IHVSGNQPFVAFQPVLYTATVSPMFGPDRGSVSFSNQSNVPILGGPVDPTGHVSVTFTGFTPGNPLIHAMYSGSSIFAPSTSSFIMVEVIKAGTGTHLASNKTNINAGESVIFSVSVSALLPSQPPAGTFPGGNVTYFDGQTAIASSFLFH